MSLAATLAADGMRPASSLPTIKCTQCGDEIEISAMGEHVCGKAPPSSNPAHASLSNPFALRAMNASGSKPAQPSPLQFDSPPSPENRPRAPTVGSTTSSTAKPRRPSLPRINPDAANRPFLAPESGPELPISPAASVRSGSSLSGKPLPTPQRSATSPMPRLWDPRPPSPELSANLDCAFPPFPIESNNRRPSLSSGRNTPAGSDRGPSRTGSRQDGKYTDAFSSEQPKSPMLNGGENVMNRLNSSPSGPFTPNDTRPNNDPSKHETKPLDRRRPSETLSPLSESPEEPPPLPTTNHATDSPTLPASFTLSDNEDVPKPLSPGKQREKKTPPERPARPTESLTPSLLDQLRVQPSPPPPVPSSFPMPPTSTGSVERSKTLPHVRDNSDDSQTSHQLSKMPSAPALRGAGSKSPLSDTTKPVPSPTQPAFPPRSSSRRGRRVDPRIGDAPPVPPATQVSGSDFSHWPSGSGSSASSTHSGDVYNSSTGASPVTSAASSIDMFSPFLSEPRTSDEDPSMRVPGLNIKSQQEPGMRAEQAKQAAPRNFARPPPPKELPPPLEEPRFQPESNWPLESPMDPGLQNGILGDAVEDQSNLSTPEPPKPLARSATSPSPRLTPEPKPLTRTATSPGVGLGPADFLSDDYDPYRARTPQPPASEEQQKEQQRQQQQPFHTRTRSQSNNDVPSDAFKLHMPTPSRSKTPQPGRPPPFAQHDQPEPPQQFPAPPPVPQEQQPTGLQRRPTVGKFSCRGCGHPIEGKSVKAADGRLTGRWHKACFVCLTCQQPFTTADFYVINNHPYCEQHYHEANGSTCAGCRRGIEGQYLETTSPGPRGRRLERKFHPRCFTCVNCRTVLAEDYFEIAGRVFCERHAMAAMRAQPRRGRGGRPPPPGGPGLMPPHGGSGLRAERRTTRLMMMS